MTPTPNRQESAADSCPHGIALSDVCEQCVDAALAGPFALLNPGGLSWKLARQVLGLQARLRRVESELSTSRAATDKTRQEADALMAQVQRWRLIESAPKDGSSILAWCSEIYDPGIRILRWHSADEAWVRAHSGVSSSYDPTHWMPLPLPPKET